MEGAGGLRECQATGPMLQVRPGCAIQSRNCVVDPGHRNQPGGPWLLFDLLWGLIGTGPKQLGPCAGELKYGYKDREGQLKQVQ